MLASVRWLAAAYASNALAGTPVVADMSSAHVPYALCSSPPDLLAWAGPEPPLGSAGAIGDATDPDGGAPTIGSITTPELDEAATSQVVTPSVVQSPAMPSSPRTGAVKPPAFGAVRRRLPVASSVARASPLGLVVQRPSAWVWSMRCYCAGTQLRSHRTGSSGSAPGPRAGRAAR